MKDVVSVRVGSNSRRHGEVNATIDNVVLYARELFLCTTVTSDCSWQAVYRGDKS